MTQDEYIIKNKNNFGLHTVFELSYIPQKITDGISTQNERLSRLKRKT